MYEARPGFAWHSILDRPVRVVVIVFFDPAADRLSCFFQTAIFIETDLFLLQAAMEALDHAVALGMVMWMRICAASTSPAEHVRHAQVRGGFVVER